MNLHRLGLPVLGVTLVAALMFTWLRSRDYDTAGYFENVALLRQIKQLDARWELDAMKSRIGLNQNYDPLVNPLRDMNLLPQHLTPLASSPQPAGSAVLYAAVVAYEQSLKDKAALVEAFKSHNAVLRNSLVFLPTAADDITRMARPLSGAAFQASANRVLLATLIYHQVPGDEARRDAEAALATLSAQTGQLSPELRERAEILAMHAAAILREHLTVNRLLNQIAEVPTAARIDAINNLLGVEQQRTVQQLQTYRSFLSLLAAALVGLLLYAAARLVRNHATINRVNAELHNMNEHLERRVRVRTAELVQANAHLQTEMAERKQLEGLLVQSEKLASIGQLAAGVAHEINNPLAFLASNFGMLERYLAGLFDMLAVYEQAESGLAPASAALVAQERERVELDYLKEDMPALVADSLGGLERVGKIVRDLKDFAHVDCEQDWKWADLRIGLASTLNIVASDLRQVAEIVTEYAAIPEVECMSSQLNQVFMNLMVNAAQAMGSQRGRITIRTGCAHDEVWVEVSDTGSGIPEHVLPHIFDPFYTTKGVGKGTGLGLSLSYGIVQNHQGRIDVETAAGQGTTFRVTLPVSRKPAATLAIKAA